MIKKRGDFMKYYNTAEVARELEIPRTTFYRYIKIMVMVANFTLQVQRQMQV